MSILVLGGTPGAGKTTLAKAYAATLDHGVCIRTDDFFDYIAEPLDPSLPLSQQQNHTVCAAWCAAAAVYAANGYEVVIEGVLGPWILPDISARLGTFDYALLHVPLALALTRCANRRGQPEARPEVIERMHPQFTAILPEWSSHLLTSADAEVATLVRALASRRREGGLRVDPL